MRGSLQRRLRGIAEPQSTDDDIEVGVDRLGQAEARERYLGDGEQARHQELVAELDLVHLDVQGRLDPPAQADDPHAGSPTSRVPRSVHSRRTTDPPAISLAESSLGERILPTVT